MKTTIPRRSAVVLALFSVAACAIIARAVQIQVLQNEVWEEKANAQISKEQVLVPPRGAILDRNGVPLAVSEARYEIGIAPNELQDPDSVRRALVQTLGISRQQAAQMTHPKRKWSVIPGRYKVEHKAALRHLKGLHFQEEIRRFYPQGDAVKPLLGRVDAEGKARGGIEEALDSLLRGAPGHERVYKDVRGRLRHSEEEGRREAVQGANVMLTIDARLQEIADQALQEVIDSTGAAGGDVVLIEPATGNILAAASRRSGAGMTLGMVTDPYEPGSIIKPFAYASLLNENKIQLSDSIHAENGSAYFSGRRITDVHPYGWLTVREALAVSSNVVVGKIIPRITPEQQYTYLRGFGFGEATGLTIGGESKGLLRSPKRWSKMSPVSLGIGYEVNVTPLQMALAYGALGNDGVYRKARLIQSIQYADGTQIPHPSHPGTRIIRPEVAQEIRGALHDVVTTGTGRNADLGSFAVGGKTGTSRAYGRGGYDGYFASFAGLFPIQQPLVAIVVRVIRPSKGAYYGGTVAAPVARNILEALLSSQSPPIDRTLLAQGLVQPIQVHIPSPTPRPFRWRDLPTTAVLTHPARPRGNSKPDTPPALAVQPAPRLAETDSLGRDQLKAARINHPVPNDSTVRDSTSP